MMQNSSGWWLGSRFDQVLNVHLVGELGGLEVLAIAEGTPFLIEGLVARPLGMEGAGVHPPDDGGRPGPDQNAIDHLGLHDQKVAVLDVVIALRGAVRLRR